MQLVENSILVVDDDQRLRDLLIGFLTASGFHAVAVGDAHAMDALLQSQRFSLYILDVNLPGESGMSICRRLRLGGDQTPIIMLTARSEDNDRIHGLELGADDYLPKPFVARELLARIKAVLRRSHLASSNPPVASISESYLSFDGYGLDIRKSILVRQGKSILLSNSEFALLKILVQRMNQTVSRAEIYRSLNHREQPVEDRSVDVMVSRLRKHIGDRSDGLPYIQSIRGKGYALVPEQLGSQP